MIAISAWGGVSGVMGSTGSPNTKDFSGLVAMPLNGATPAAITRPALEQTGNGRATDAGRNPLADHQPALACFEDELSALAYFESIVWPNGRICPRCRVPGLCWSAVGSDALRAGR